MPHPLNQIFVFVFETGQPEFMLVRMTICFALHERMATMMRGVVYASYFRNLVRFLTVRIDIMTIFTMFHYFP